jgi:putative Ca2+/H+ antiporter (TMEM165/GDT1 family)
MLATFLFLFVTIYISQMGDKTQILTLLLAAKTRKHFFLFLAIMTGFAVSVTLASVFGAGISTVIPHKTLKLITGIIFILLGVIIFFNAKKKAKSPRKLKVKHQFLSVALLIFLSDFGDKTQIAVALLSTDYSPFLVFVAAMAALGLDTVLMIFFSKAITKRFKETTIKKLAGGVFAAIGVYLLATGF